MGSLVEQNVLKVIEQNQPVDVKKVDRDENNRDGRTI